MNIEETKLNTKETIRALIQRELKHIVYQSGAPFIKFLLFTSVIEFMGACLDSFPFQEEKRSEERFNTALKRLFPNRYSQFAKKSARFYLYEGFRCQMVHRLKPKGFAFTTRKEAENEGNSHLQIDSTNEKWMVLVLEDFYDDIEKASEKLVSWFDKGLAIKSKGEEVQLTIVKKSKQQ